MEGQVHMEMAMVVEGMVVVVGEEVVLLIHPNCGGGGGVGLYGQGTSGVKPSSTGQPGTGGSGGTNEPCW